MTALRTTRQRRVLVLTVVLACLSSAVRHAVALPRFDNAWPERAAVLERAESALERGDAIAALDDFERAAMMLHARDAEMGLIRAALQDGQYRRALGFAAHTAGGHLEAADAAALYAWLLRMGGQPAQAERVLDDARRRTPADAVANAVASAFGAPLPVAIGALLEPPHRMAPWPSAPSGQLPVPPAARMVGGAVLLDDGHAAIAPLMALPASSDTKVWVRNGLGQSREAVVDRSNAALESAGVAVLRLKARLNPGDRPAAAAREPFAGAPGYALQFSDGGAPAWPWLHQGFFGSADGSTGKRRLGFAVDGGLPGAAVLDAAGRLVGITLGEADRPRVWVPATTWRDLAPHAFAPTEAPATRALASPDMVYEAGMRIALQVLAVD